MPRIVEVLTITDYHLDIALDIFLQDVFYYKQQYPEFNTDKVVINAKNAIIGTPIYENKQLVSCPQCGQGLLFMHHSTSHIECTNDENCNFKIPLKNKI